MIKYSWIIILFQFLKWVKNQWKHQSIEINGIVLMFELILIKLLMKLLIELWNLSLSIRYEPNLICLLALSVADQSSAILHIILISWYRDFIDRFILTFHNMAKLRKITETLTYLITLMQLLPRNIYHFNNVHFQHMKIM